MRDYSMEMDVNHALLVVIVVEGIFALQKVCVEKSDVN
jgi:hypothetical protein